MNNDAEKLKLNEKLVELLTVLDKVCQENDIRYFVFAGTMLGAVRHGGIIPWDDDIDVAIPRDDYNKLKEISLKGAFKPPFFLQNPGSDQGFPKGYCRLRNSNTTEIPIVDVFEKCNHGVFIDIFPLDRVPDSEKKFKRQINKLTRIRMVINVYARYFSGIGSAGASLTQRFGYLFFSLLFKLGFLKVQRLYEKYEKTAMRYHSEKTSRIGTIAGTLGNKRYIYSSELWESNVIWLKFESIQVPVPKAYDAILTHSYGNYMIPRKEKNNHGETYFSATIPFQEYIENNKNMLMKKRFELTKRGRTVNTNR